MAKKKLSYWEKRSLKLTEKTFNSSDEYVEAIAKIYDETIINLSKEISFHLNKIADNNDISLQEAKKLLNDNELKIFKTTLNDFKKKSKGQITPQLEKELDLISRRVRISRLQAMEINFKTTVDNLMTKEEQTLFSHLSKIYEDTYYRQVFDLQVIQGYKTISKISEKVLKEMVMSPWSTDKVNFSKRIWGRGDKLNSMLSTELTQSIVRGDSPNQIIKNLTKEFNTSKSNAARLVRTESAAIHSRARKQSYDDSNLDQYEILSTLDTRTSNICRDMDGRVFDMKDFKPGITAPPFHPNCRTTHIPYIDDDIQREMENSMGRMARDTKTVRSVKVENITYHDWYKRYVK